MECGRALFRPCPNCPGEIAVWDAFCPNCGYQPGDTALRQRGDISRGTILAASFEGLRDISEQLPPALLSGILNDLFDLLSEPVVRYDGTVNTYDGDGILAYFPARRYQETNAVRAVEAALGMHDALRRFAAERAPGLRMRIGISTGLVLAAESGSTAPRQISLVGSVVDLASSLGREAEPDSILVEEGTYQLAEHAFEFEERPSMAIRGRLELITPFVPLRRIASVPR